MPAADREFLERRREWRRQRGLPDDSPEGLDVPDIDERNLELWQAWCELSATRGVGFEAEPIRCADVLAWCDLHAVGQWRRPMVWRVILALETERRGHGEGSESRD